MPLPIPHGLFAIAKGFVLDLLLLTALGFLGSFGHCAGMCGPLTVAFSLSGDRGKSSNWQRSLGFHGLLNLGRILSYSLAGAILGGVGSVLIASGQLAGIGSSLRQAIATIAGLMLIWFGGVQIKPGFLPNLPWVHPLTEFWHKRLSGAIARFSGTSGWWTPGVLGIAWGLMPCGFLYTAQIKAAATGDWVWGAAAMFCFGLGTLPVMLGVGFSAARLGANRRSQLFRLGGWVTLTVGILTLLRTDAMVDYTGHGAFFLLMLALVARPISYWFPALLQYRRAIGVGAFVLALAHTGHMLEHSLNWNLGAIAFLLPLHRWGFSAGAIAFFLLVPLAFTSLDYWQRVLGKHWRRLHLLSVPAFLLAAIHAVLIGSHYWGDLTPTWQHHLRGSLLLALALLILGVRSRLFWSLFSLAQFYTRPNSR